jgi:NDP-sugar pyrophosphorylase family protein
LDGLGSGAPPGSAWTSAMQVPTDWTVCVLAGGLSRRLRPLTETVPKPMLPVGDRPFLHHLLDHFASLGFRRFVLAVAYLWEQVREHFGDGGRFGWQIEYAVEPQPLGTGGAALWAQPLWGARAVVANGDTFLAEDWRRMVAAHRAGGLPATMALVRQDDGARYGSVELADGRVARFLEKRPDAGPGWINAGVYVLEAHALARYRRGQPFSLERDVFPALAGRIGAYLCTGPFADIGTPESLAAFRRRAQ